jgi:2'-5' RNA ligase
MIYSLVHLPDIDAERINQIRRKYDPQVELIQPHITILFPVPESIGEDKLIDHLVNVLRDWKSVSIRLRGLAKSPDDYLFLLVDEGKDALVDLHMQIHTGALGDLRQTDLPYVPHVTLGVFRDNENEYAQALAEAKQLDLDYRCAMHTLHLLTLDDQRTRVVSSREFLLT